MSFENIKDITIERTNDPLHPIHDFDNLGHFALSAGGYDIGEQNYIHNLRTTIRSAKNFAQKYEHEYDLNRLPDLEELGERLGVFAVKLEVFGYLHSGLALSLSRTGQFACQFDSGKAGFIYVTKDRIREEYGIKKVTKKYIDRARETMIKEFDTLQSWLAGDVWTVNYIDSNDCIDISDDDFFGNDINTSGLLSSVPDKLKPLAVKAWQSAQCA